MFRALVVAAVAAFCSAPARAQDFPNRPLTMIVPFAAGGTSDIIARLAAEEMGQILGQRITVENISGAGGSIGLSRLASAPPDGYTLGIGNAGTSAAIYTLHKKVTFTPEAFQPVGIIAKTVPVIALRNTFPAKTVPEFLAHARANPGKVTLAHAGIGSSNYLICKLFLQASGVQVELMGYRGAGPALNDAMGGHVDGVCDAATSVASAINGNTVQGLVAASKARVPTMAQVPTATEAGIPAFTNEGWNALFLPRGTPEPIVTRLNEALRKAVTSERFSRRLAELSTLPARDEELNPAFVQSFVQSEVQRYKELLKGVEVQ
ncbi:MAG: tripartite tricarboxylate transporter substrate binding protein BugD [Proteobacteria bacterium]|nr:tripartite tricarboxylate transporter substrate binding protein BugD [Pseudomonadota bacterium]